jgi:hypothetical protein
MGSSVKRPDALYIGPHQYRLIWDTAAMDALRTKREEPELGGLINYHDQTITLDPSTAPGYQRRVLIHEVLHAILDVTGWNSDPPKKPDIDDFLVRIDSMLLDTMRRNPDWVKWLMAPAERGG